MKGLYKLQENKLIFEDKEITSSDGTIIQTKECENTLAEIDGWRWFECLEDAKEYFKIDDKQTE